MIGNWVVNYNGGLSLGLIPLNNEVWSPVIDWDDPNSVEDDALVGGAFMRFTVWQHLPLPNGMFWIWSVRSRENGDWSPWTNRNFVYFGDGGGVYNNTQFDVTDLLTPGLDAVQISLGVTDLAEGFGFPGTDATLTELRQRQFLAVQRRRPGLRHPQHRPVPGWLPQQRFGGPARSRIALGPHGHGAGHQLGNPECPG